MKLLFSVSALCGMFVLLRCVEGAYHPECVSLDGAIANIQQSLAQIQSIEGLRDSSINCTKNTECTGLTCIMGFQGQFTELTLELKPCEQPPQMFVLMQDVGGEQPFVEQTVSHGDSFPVPGLMFRHDFFALQAALAFRFQKVDDGISLGLSLVFVAGGVTVISVPLLPPTVISVPDCPSTDVDDQCTNMQTLVDSLTPPHDFQCLKNPDCKGFNCTGIIVTPVGALSVLASLVIDSCTNPVSFNISVGPPTGPPTAAHVFKKSGNVQLVFDYLPRGVTADLNVTMIPYTADIDYIRTTIEVLLCIPGGECIKDIFINNALVPIPPCDNPVPFPGSDSTAPTTPLPGSADECSTMTAIAEDIQSNPFFAQNAIYCHRNGPCDGVDCTLSLNHGNFEISVKLFHCEDPVRVHVTIKRTGTDDQQDSDVYHDEVIDIDEITTGGSLKFLLVQRESDEVELAMSLRLQPGYNEVYLIQDRIIPVPPCPSPAPTGIQSSTTTERMGPTARPPKTGASPAPTGIQSSTTTERMGPTARPPKTGVTTKTPMKTEGNKKDPKKNKKDPKANQQSKPATIGIGVGIAGLIAVVVIILVGVWYYRRNRSASDHVALMESSSAPI